MKIYIGADHAGFEQKEKIKQYLDDRGIDFEDLGTGSEETVDYPDIAKLVAQKVSQGSAEGILVCGTGNGMAIAANKVKGIRAVVGYTASTAKLGREDNDANILCFGGRVQRYNEIEKILDAWFSANFSSELRHKMRIKKIRELENG